MPTYSLRAYGGMIGDPVRVDAYEAALREAIRPGSTVVEIGAGSGFFTVLAVRLGAGHVHAIESDPSVQVARETVERNGVGDRVTFHEALSTRVTLPEPADVLFSDLRGILPPFQHHIATVKDARERLLKPGGVQIPRMDRIRFAPVETEAAYRKQTTPWGENHLGLDLSPSSGRLVHSFTKVRVKPEELLAPALDWTTLDYTTISDPNLSGTLEWDLERSGTGHGIVGWFDAELLPGIGFSNAPGAPEALYGQALFPFESPIDCREGDRLKVDLRAYLIDGDYVWHWRTWRTPGGEGGRPEVRYSQSTIQAVPLSPDRLRKGGEPYVPRLGDDGTSDLAILQAMDGSRSVKQIAEWAQTRFPERFKGYREALDRVSALSRKYSE